MVNIRDSNHRKNLFSYLYQRGLVAQYSHKQIIERLFTRGEVVFYVGFDPTNDSLHVGNLLLIKVLMHLVHGGQRGIVLLGGGTASIGDPSGKTKQRKIMSYDKIEENTVRIKGQLQRILARYNIEVEYYDNAQWLFPLRYIDFLRTIGKHFSVNRMLSFETYKARMERGLSFIEFNYQLLQAYDYYYLYTTYGCNMQIGGDDQWGNMVAGMDLIRRLKASDTSVLTTPLVLTASGEKMGKTDKGAIFLDRSKTPVFDFYQYWRNIDDKDVKRFLLYYTDMPIIDIEQLTFRDGAALNIAKELLAYQMTALVHGEEEAKSIEGTVKGLFSQNVVGLDIPGKKMPYHRIEQGINVVTLFTESSLCRSTSEARRLIAGNGAYINSRRMRSHEEMIHVQDIKDGKILLQAGKKRAFCFTIVKNSDISS